jgi:hypothetical protein
MPKSKYQNSSHRSDQSNRNRGAGVNSDIHHCGLLIANGADVAVVQQSLSKDR